MIHWPPNTIIRTMGNSNGFMLSDKKSRYKVIKDYGSNVDVFDFQTNRLRNFLASDSMKSRFEIETTGDEFQIGDIVKILESTTEYDLMVGSHEIDLFKGKIGEVIKIYSKREQSDLKYVVYLGRNKGLHTGDGLKEEHSCLRVPERCLGFIRRFSFNKKDEDTVLITQQMESM